MEMILYNNYSDNRVINKSISQLLTVDIVLKNECEFLHPVVTLSAAHLPPAANYAYIGKFSRYYYITNQRIIPGCQIELTLDVDVLMSWRTFLQQNARVVAERSSSVPNKKLPDVIPVLANRNVIYKKFNGGIDGFGSQNITANSKCYCLTVLNGNVLLDPPAKLTLTQISGSTFIKVSWSAITGALAYNVDVKSDGGDWTNVVTATAFTFTQIIAPSMGLCYVRVAPVDLAGNLIGNYATSSITVEG